MIQVRLSHVLIVTGAFVLAYMLSALSTILLPFVLGFAAHFAAASAHQPRQLLVCLCRLVL